MASVILQGTTSGATTIQPVDAVTATITLPSATSTLATLAGTETLTNKALNGTLGATTPSTVVATTGSFKNALMTNPVTLSGNSTNTTYGLLSFNNVDTAAGTVGIWSGADSDLRYAVPTGGSHVFRINNATQATIDTSGNVGIGVTPAGTGGCLQLKSGITFPATQSASTDANTLDDYEEGTWSATLTPSISGSITVGNNTGWYVKVGNLVTVGVNIFMSSVSSPVGFVGVNGLPFTSVSGNSKRPAVAASGLVLTSYLGAVSGQIDANSSTATLVVNDQENWANTIGVSSQIQFMASYVVA